MEEHAKNLSETHPIQPRLVQLGELLLLFLVLIELSGICDLVGHSGLSLAIKIPAFVVVAAAMVWASKSFYQK
ncbi:MAG TPA: hypothetical protein VFX17_02795 [Patescibacteria group bacterium]|nr:hypothetical protein [Patescibacteria group bacterium]